MNITVLSGEKVGLLFISEYINQSGLYYMIIIFFKKK